VTFAGDVFRASISPDGRSLAYEAGQWNREVRVLVRARAFAPADRMAELQAGLQRAVTP
jgi:hypothetical protein